MRQGHEPRYLRAAWSPYAATIGSAILTSTPPSSPMASGIAVSGALGTAKPIFEGYAFRSDIATVSTQDGQMANRHFTGNPTRNTCMKYPTCHRRQGPWLPPLSQCHVCLWHLVHFSHLIIPISLTRTSTLGLYALCTSRVRVRRSNRSPSKTTRDCACLNA